MRKIGALRVKMVLKCFVCVLWIFLLTADARPEPPYYYPPPALRSNPSPSISTAQNFGQTVSPAQNYNNIPSTSYGTPVLRSSNAGLSVTSSSAASGTQLGYSSGSSPSRSYGTPDLLSSHQAPSRNYIPQPGPVNIQRHIYVHVAPPDVEEERQQRVQQQEVSRQKHYKIIFIKAPTYNPPAQYIAQQQAQQEEKTLVYVLVKKPEEPEEIVAPQVAPAKINKPEVYFIKYKAKSEQNLQGGQNVQQQIENVQEENDSVVIESAAGRGASSAGGYNYDRPAGAFN